MNDAQRVLLVEDEATIAGFMTTVLRVNGYEVLRAANGNRSEGAHV